MHNSTNLRSRHLMTSVIQPPLDHKFGYSTASFRGDQPSKNIQHNMHLDYHDYDKELQYLKRLHNFEQPITEQNTNVYNDSPEEYCSRHIQQQAVSGGGDYKPGPLPKHSNCHQNEYVLQHKRSQTECKQRKSDETFSQSDHSGSTRQTVLKKQTTNGKQLLDLVSSKASLQKTIEDSISGVNKPQKCCCNSSCKITAGNLVKKHEKTLNSKLRCFESEEDLQCSTSQSAELINDKIIHPMVKKFRLLFLRNIKEEVGLMEELEKLPNELTKFCQEMEKNA